MSDSERVQYKFMIPVWLKDELEAAAARSRRSLSAEVIVRLSDSVRKRAFVSDDPLLNEREALQDELRATKIEINTAMHRVDALQKRLDSVEEAINARPPWPPDAS